MRVDTIDMPRIQTLDELLKGEVIEPLAVQEVESGWEDALAAELDNPNDTPYDSSAYDNVLDFLRSSLPEAS